MKKISEEVQQQVVSLYVRYHRIKLVSQYLGLGEKTVRTILKNKHIATTPYHLRRKKYTLNHQYLDCIDSLEKAYVLGFLFGDGYIRRQNSGYVVKLELNTKDENILVKIRELFGSNAPITRRHRYRRDTLCHTSCLILCNKYLYQILVGHGLTERKSFTCSYPQIPSQFAAGFVLGLSDADGHIKHKKPNRGIWSLIGSVAMMEDIRKILQQQCIETRFILDSQLSQPMARLVITKRDMILRLRDWLYQSNVYLERKRDEFFKIVS